jgi:hypothetical protein
MFPRRLLPALIAAARPGALAHAAETRMTAEGTRRPGWS